MRRFCRLGAVILIVASCSGPGDSAEAGTDSEAGSSSPTEATTPGSTTPASTTTPDTMSDDTSAATGEPTSDSGGSGCVDECPTAGTGCDGDTLEVCTEGLDGCNDFEEVPCEYGCMGGECLDAMADLDASITAITAMGSTYTVDFRVTNRGVADSGAFRADIWFTRTFASPPQVGDLGDQYQSNISSLAPDESVDLQATMTIAAAGDAVAVVIVDTLQAIPELDENNNVALGHAWTDDSLTVFTSFTSDQPPVTIPTNGTTVTMSTDVAVPGTTNPEVFFSVNVTHPRVEDLEVTVVVPGAGPQRLLLSGASAGGNLQSATFRDGGTDLASGAPPYLGEFAPAGNWVGGGGLPTSGTYDLEIRDAGMSDDEGRLNAFSVHFYEFDP